jgi:Holliday junction resolvase-like predicted endonuclease
MNRQTLFFLEVRYRKTAPYGYAAASVKAKKQAKPLLTTNITCKKTSMATECRAG